MYTVRKSSLLLFGLFLFYASFLWIGFKEGRSTYQPHHYFNMGRKYENIDYGLAIEYYEKAIAEIKPQLTHTSDSYKWKHYFEIVTSLSKCHSDRLDSRNALGVINLAFEYLHIHAESLNPTDTLELLLQKSLLLKGELAYKLMQQAISVQLEPNVQSLYCLGRYYTNSGHREQAIGTYHKALSKLERQSGDVDLASRILIQLGLSYIHNSDSVVYYFNRIIDINEGGQGKKYPLLWAYYQLGRIALMKGQSEQALKYNTLLVQLHEQLKVWPSQTDFGARIYNTLGLSYKEVGDYENALLYMDKTIFIYRQLKMTDQLLKKKMNKAAIFMNVGKYDNAKDILEHILPDLKSRKDTLNIISVYNNLGIVYERKGEYKAAKFYHEKSLLLKQKQHQPNPRFIAKSYLNLSNLAFRQDQLMIAEDYLLNGLKQLSILEESHGTLAADLHNQLGNIYFKQKIYQKALKAFALSVQAIAPKYIDSEHFYEIAFDSTIISRQELIAPIAGIASVQYQLFQKKKDQSYLKLAATSYKIAIKIIEQIRNTYTTEGTKGEWMSKVHSVFEGGIAVSIALKDQYSKKEAFQFFEKSKSSLLFEALQDSRSKKYANLPDSLLNKEQGLKGLLTNCQSEIIKEQEASQPNLNKIGRLQNSLLDWRKQYDELIQELEERYPQYYDLKYNSKVISVEEVQQELKGRKTALIEYFLGDSSLFTYTITPDTFFIVQQRMDSSFFNELNQMQSILRVPAGSDKEYYSFISCSRILYEYLLNPVITRLQKHLDIDKLLIIPDGILGYLPFEVLLTQRPEEHLMERQAYRQLPYLFKQYVVRYEYSAGLILSNHAVTEQAGRYIGMAPFSKLSDRRKSNSITGLEENDMAIFRNNLQILSESEEEVRTLAGEYGLYYLAPDATIACFEKQAYNCNIIHLATHTYVNDIDPLYKSGFIFNSEPDDSLDYSYLPAYKLYNMKLNAKLAILSACNTGLGKLQRGEGILSLARAFKYANCPNIVMSFWQANDRSAKELMIIFHKYLKAGLAKDVALQQARWEFLETTSNEGFTHPSKWATFVLIGNDAPLEFKNRDWKYILIGTLLILFFGIFWKKSEHLF